MQQKNQGNGAISFLTFLADYDFVKIPRIQRDYVQGGKDDKAKDIREGFLADLKAAVMGEKELSLDFIYGVCENNTFLPLDGQQRLTTLFLLYWYGVRQLDCNERRKEILGLLKKFSYQTRFSSEDFCDLLFNESLISGNEKGEESIEKLITDNPGFSRFWRYDPTVDSMLNMLNDIDLKFKGTVTVEQWKSFFDNETVRFFKFGIENSQKPDDLYVKMNARGKHLTYFENLKARLQQWMPDGDDKIYWKRAIDSIWSDFFWKTSRAAEEKYTEKDPAPALIDKPFWIFLYWRRSRSCTAYFFKAT